MVSIELEFRVLGPIAVRSGSGTVAPAGRLQGLLLGLLLARANQPVSVDLLAESLWGGRDERSSQKLQLHVHKLRRRLGEPERLAFDATGYRLAVAPGELDAERFESLIDEAGGVARSNPELAVELFRSALALWRGNPFDGLDAPPITDEARRLTELRLDAAEELYQAELDCGRHLAIVPELADLAARHPLRERLHGVLMLALYRAGRQAEALDVYRNVRGTLVGELGLEPGPELRDIERRILAGEPIPSSGAPARRPAQLPGTDRTFVGRSKEIAELDDLFAANGTDGAAPLICVLAGTGGVGKTALAVRWAHRVRAEFPDGQLYVDLSGYGPEQPVEPEAALAGFLRALGVDGPVVPPGLADRAARFRSLADGKRMLVVLDNARSLEQVRPLLPGTASCVVVVTSRDSLAGLVAREGARRLALDRLPSDDARELVQALVGERADATPAAVGSLIERCSRLPLALRIAAELINSRRGVTVTDLARELTDERVRLDLLDVNGDPHTAVRAVLSWSYQHLSAASGRLFRLIGLAPGGGLSEHTLAALGGDDLGITRRLVGVLVRAHLLDEVAPGRYEMHDLLAAFAAELVLRTEAADDRAAAIRRLLACHVQTALAAGRVFDPFARIARFDPVPPPGPVASFRDRTDAAHWYEAERVGLVAAIQLAGTYGEHELAWQLAATLLSFFYHGKHWEDWIGAYESALVGARESADEAGMAVLLDGLGNAYDDLGRGAEAIVRHVEADVLYRRLGDLRGAAWNANNLGVVYDNDGDFDTAISWYRDALSLFAEVGDARGEGICLNNLGDVHRQLGRLDEAGRYLGQAMDVQERAGDTAAQRFTVCTLGHLRRDQGRREEAIEFYEQALAVSLDLGERWRAAWLRTCIGDELAATGKVPAAMEHRRQALAVFTELGDPLAGRLRGLLDDR